MHTCATEKSLTFFKRTGNVCMAVGRISCDSGTARRNIGRKGLKPLVHCDYLYLE